MLLIGKEDFMPLSDMKQVLTPKCIIHIFFKKVRATLSTQNNRGPVTVTHYSH